MEVSPRGLHSRGWWTAVAVKRSCIFDLQIRVWHDSYGAAMNVEHRRDGVPRRPVTQMSGMQRKQYAIDRHFGSAKFIQTIYRKMFWMYLPTRVVGPYFDTLLILHNIFLVPGNFKSWTQFYFLSFMGMNLLNLYFCSVIHMRAYGVKSQGVGGYSMSPQVHED